MSKHIAIAASKGGTGKTTSVWNLGFGLALAGARVLIVDCDPQDNLRLIADIEDSKNSVASAIETARRRLRKFARASICFQAEDEDSRRRSLHPTG
ncbi:MAG: ParA family protein [Acidobacteriota bacterium]